MIVEIGGGEGALTDYLSKSGSLLTVIEKDSYYACFLKNKYSDTEYLEVIEGDALDFDYSGYDKLIANLPYTITEPFLVNLASTGALSSNSKSPKSSKLKSLTLVLSQNSVRKMVAPIKVTEGNSRLFNQEFGIMGAISHAFFDIDIITVIPSTAFYPEPAVTSVLVTLKPKKKRTSVDRIMGEFLTDKKGISPAINSVYHKLMAQAKVYNTKKYNFRGASFSNFTTPAIGAKNIYDLNNMQLSQLIQDLIRNDTKIRGSRSNGVRLSINKSPVNTWELEEDEYRETTALIKTKKQMKSEKKFDYLLNDQKYNVLLRRGLEYLSDEELHELLK
ncbi:rRNA adenine N-6-methyltransferase family protein [Enterococcus sp. AZ109]|uniref:rRNA adenine N-6-methyltransferase family protein n=1 Tax=Enterococcus sp. AZ109 TaxID=2774634 RepID=UPI003F290C65